MPKKASVGNNCKANLSMNKNSSSSTGDVEAGDRKGARIHDDSPIAKVSHHN